MSSGDIAVGPSSIPNSDTKTNILPTSNDTEGSEQDSTKSSSLSQHPDKAEKSNLPNSVSDFDLHEQSLIPSNSSTSDSLENMAPGIREVRSLEAEDVGELKRENAKSAFEITSFRPATDDLDKSVAGRPTSTDSLTLHTVPEKGESEESVATPTNKQRLSDTQSESSLHQTAKANLAERDTAATEPLDDGNEVSVGNAASSSPKTVPTMVDEPASKPSTHPPPGMTAQPGNGAGVQPNRFRRVNLYERGRWTIRDTLVTEEAAEGTPSQKQQQLLPSEGSSSRQPLLSTKQHQDSSESSNGTSPPLKPAQQRSDSTTASSEPPQLQVSMELIALSGIVGGGLAPESVSDKDSSSIHMDRSSTAAETLSRNTSMSSILALEKSVDGDELIRDIDVDSMVGVTGNQNLSQDQDVSDVPVVSPQPPVVSTASSSAVPPPSSTAIPREEQPAAPALQNVEVRRARVENAMSFLQNELKEVLASSSYPSLIEENRLLKGEQTLMDQANIKLETELSLTKDELQATREENTRLKKELKELRSNLTRLALVPESSTGGNGSGTSSLQLAPSEDVAQAPPTSDDASNSSQDVST